MGSDNVRLADNVGTYLFNANLVSYTSVKWQTE